MMKYKNWDPVFNGQYVQRAAINDAVTLLKEGILKEAKHHQDTISCSVVMILIDHAFENCIIGGEVKS